VNWRLAIDFGTTATAAAIHQGETELLQIEGLGRLPSLVMLGADGVPVVGAAAERQAAGAPDRVERTPKRRLGDRVLLLGGQAVDPVDLVAAVLRSVADEARRHQGGSDPAEVILTHPASWAGHRLAALREAARRAGLGEVTLLPEPVAAAMHLADDRVGIGDHVAVYDLGGGTFDCAVLRRTGTGFEPVGAPGGDERLGGEHFDELLYNTVGKTIAVRHPELWEQLTTSDDRSWVRANQALRQEVRLAKEALSSTPEYVIYAPSPIDQEIRLTREELEQLLRASLERSVDELVATIERAGLTPADIKAVYLAGGSSRMPLVTRMLSERTGMVPFTWGDPKAAVALGAASRAGGPPAPVVLAPPADITTVTPAVAATAAASSHPRTSTATAPAPRRWGRPAVLAGVGLVVALLAGVLIASQGGDPTKDDLTQGGSADEPLEHAFPAVDSDGLHTTRMWTFDPAEGTLASVVTVKNTTTERRTFGVFEVVPKEVADDAGKMKFDPSPVIVEADPVVRYDLDLAAGEERTLRWTVALSGEVDAARLEELAGLRDAAEKAYLEAIAAGTTTTSITGPSSSTTGTTSRSTTTTKPPSTTTGPTGTTGTGPTTTSTSITGPSTTATTTTTTTAASTAPSVVASFRVGNPQPAETSGDDYTKVSVDLSWAAPGDNGGKPVTGYVVRCTTMQGAAAYTAAPPPDVPCRNGIQVATPSATATSASVTIDRVYPASTWIKWEIAAVNSVGVGAYRTAQVIVPNVVGQLSWNAYQLARIVGLTAQGGTKPACTVTDTICEQSLAAGGEAGNGQAFVMYEKAA